MFCVFTYLCFWDCSTVTIIPPRGNGLIPGRQKKNFPRLGVITILRRDNIPPAFATRGKKKSGMNNLIYG